MSLLKLRATGRGRGFTPWRGLLESVQRVAYAGDWPARLLARWPALNPVRVVRHQLPLLPPGRPPLRIGFASDLHLGPLTPRSLLEEAFALLADARPHVLALGGDYVSLDATPAIAAQLASLVAGVPAPVKAAVLGNHDLWTEHRLLEDALAAAGARVLVNEALALPPPYDDVILIGLDDVWTGRVDAARAFAASSAPVKVVLAHAPETVPRLAGQTAQLMLCGHTHGGQVATPWGPLVIHGELGRRWPHGVHQVGELCLIVSRGLGFSDLPLRVCAPSDVVICDLV